MTGIGKRIWGVLKVELTAADLEKTFREINRHNIAVFQIRQEGDLTATFWIRRQDLGPLERLANQQGDGLRVLERRGIYWQLAGLRHRPVLVGGLLTAFFLCLVLPTRVLFVQVEGNIRIPENQILAAAENCGIGFGASRRQVRSERVKNALLEEIPQLQWAGVNTAGCTAVISVKERQIPDEEAQTGVSSIVASRDGFVLSCTATKGNALCVPGQAVSKGQVLISGYTDCGICIQVTQAEGEIYAQTEREISVKTPSAALLRGEQKTVKKRYSLIIGKKRINLWKDSGIWDTTCGRMYEEYYITLPGGFRLPAALAVDTYFVWECYEEPVTREQVEQELVRFARAYTDQQMIAGSILSSKESLLEEAESYILQGRYVCTEMIGRVQREQIGEGYEQNG